MIMAQNQIPYRIVQVHIDDFNMKDQPMEEGAKYGVKSNYIFQTQFDQRLIRCTSNYTFVKYDEAILNLQLSCVFEVEPEAYDGMFNEDRSILTVPEYFCRYMATIAVGAARGVIAAKVERTNLENLVLPPINLIDTIQRDTVFNVEKHANK